MCTQATVGHSLRLRIGTRIQSLGRNPASGRTTRVVWPLSNGRILSCLGDFGNGTHMFRHDGQAYQMIGTVMKEFDTYPTRLNSIFTAGVSMIELLEGVSVPNVLSWNDFYGVHQSYPLQMYNGDVRAGTEVMLINRNGVPVNGVVALTSFSSPVDNLHNVLLVQNPELFRPISDEGDKGLLVTSIPQAESTFMYVYGMVTGRHISRQQLKISPRYSVVVPLYPTLKELFGSHTESYDSGFVTAVMP